MLNGAPMAPTVANLKFAHRLATEIKERIRCGTFSMVEYFPASGAGPSTLTVAAQLATWRGTLRLEDSTLAGYDSAIRFWKAAPFDKEDPDRLLGDRALRALTSVDIKTALASRKDLSGKTVNNYVSCLREALQLAVPAILPTNPAADVPRATHQKEPPDPFTREQAEAIVAQAHKRYPGQVAHLVEFWMFTGLRTSELFGLRWEAIDWSLKQMQIRQALVRGKLKGTKTSTVRDVALNSRALAALKAQQEHTRLSAHGFVFEDPRYRESWVDERAFRRSFWTPLLRACGIRYRRAYHCRHTFATMMLMAGARPAYAAKQMGHSVDQFLNTYTRWIDDGHSELEQRRLEAFIGANIPGTSPKSETAT
jgi:integrase